MRQAARVLALVLGGVWLATGASAQDTLTAQQPITVTVTVGPLGLGDLQSQPVRAERLDETGLATEEATLDRVIGAGSGFRASASVAMAMGRSWSVRLAGTVGRVRLDHAFAGEDAWVLEAAGIPIDGDEGVSVAGIEAALRFRIPSVQAFRPYLELGVAAERWQGAADAPFPGAEVLAEPLTRIGAHGAVGGDYPLTDRLGAKIQASTRFQRTPLDPLPEGVELARTDTLVLTTMASPGRAFADAAIEHLTALRLELGLSYALGGTVAARRDRPESDESQSAPLR